MELADCAWHEMGCMQCPRFGLFGMCKLGTGPAQPLLPHCLALCFMVPILKCNACRAVALRVSYAKMVDNACSTFALCLSFAFVHLQWAEEQISHHEATPSGIQHEVTDRITKGGGRVDYVSVTDAENLQELKHFISGQEVLVAIDAFFGSVRLIDNVVTVKQAG